MSEFKLHKDYTTQSITFSGKISREDVVKAKLSELDLYHLRSLERKWVDNSKISAILQLLSLLFHGIEDKG